MTAAKRIVPEWTSYDNEMKLLWDHVYKSAPTDSQTIQTGESFFSLSFLLLQYSSNCDSGMGKFSNSKCNLNFDESKKYRKAPSFRLLLKPTESNVCRVNLLDRTNLCLEENLPASKVELFMCSPLNCLKR